jgi:hypothetical protein
VLDLQVAVEAVHFVFCNVRAMEELDVSQTSQARWIVMTYIAALLGDVAIALDDVVVAEGALHAQALHVSVIEGESRGGDELLWDFVTQRAARGALVELCIFEMTQEARALRDGDVLPLNYLGVAARAAQFLLAAHLEQMGPVIKEHVLEDFAAHQEALFVAAGAQARLVGDLSPRVSPVRPGEVFDDHGEGFVFLLKFCGDPRRDVALDAGDIVVRRGLPRFIVGLHDMARPAERRLGAGLHRQERRGNPHGHEDQHDLQRSQSPGPHRCSPCRSRSAR